MQKQGMKEIKLEIRNEFVMNIMNYFMTQEGYLFVGNEKEVWLENLSHPTVQLIYVNQASIYNEMQEKTLLKIINRVRTRIRKRYLMPRLNVLVIQVGHSSGYEGTLNQRYLMQVPAANEAMLKQNEEVMQLFPTLTQTSLQRSVSELMLELHYTSKEKAQHVQQLLTHQKYPVVTGIFILSCIALFVVVMLQPESNAATGVLFGAKYNPLIVAGEYYRLLTPAFLHLGVMHLLLNCVFIYQMGKLIEQSFGWWRMIIIMLGSAILGNLFSFGFSTTISLGASTVAYGLIGALLFLGLENRKMFMHLIRGIVFPILGFSLIWGMIDQSIDLYGHLGGFLGGFLVTSLIGNPAMKPYWQRIVLSVATIALLVSGTYIRGTKITAQTNFNELNIALLYYYVQYGSQAQAMELMEKLDIQLELPNVEIN